MVVIEPTAGDRGRGVAAERMIEALEAYADALNDDPLFPSGRDAMAEELRTLVDAAGDAVDDIVTRALAGIEGVRIDRRRS